MMNAATSNPAQQNSRRQSAYWWQNLASTATTGSEVVARVLRDAGMEVIYTGLYKTPLQVVQAAIQEDVDVIGVSLLSGSHVPLFRELGRCLQEQRAGHIFVVAGGVIPEQDYEALIDGGVDAIVPQEARVETIVTTITDLVTSRGRI